MQAVLGLYAHRLGAGGRIGLPAARRIIYVVDGTIGLDGADLAADEARLATQACGLEAAKAAHVLCWELRRADEDAPAGAEIAAEVTLDQSAGCLMRCDRVDFPPGGVAYLHTHQGPGIRCLIAGSFRVETGGRTLEIDPFGAWFEAGPEPVYAAGDPDEPSAFVRVMVLPRRLKGRSSIRYVNAEDQAKPKSQRYTVFVDEFIEL